MARTTSTLVEGIIAVDSTSIPDLTPFIDVANQLVTDVCTDSDYTDAKLAIIETWLAAHFYAIRDPRPDSQKAGSVSQKLQYKVDLNLAVTTYGQQAMIIDTAGNLAKLNKQATTGNVVASASITWMGDDYYD